MQISVILSTSLFNLLYFFNLADCGAPCSSHKLKTPWIPLNGRELLLNGILARQKRAGSGRSHEPGRADEAVKREPDNGMVETKRRTADGNQTRVTASAVAQDAERSSRLCPDPQEIP